jgi:ABC-type protease/lipase transport system fused ATPase/permease subunit
MVVCGPCNIARMQSAEDETVVSAATLAHDMIQQLSQGYDTGIGDGLC